MKLSDFGHRAVSLIVLIAFIALLQGGPAPAQTTSAPGDATSGTRLEDNGTPGSFEAEAQAPAVVKKHKKFPWLVATLGAVAVGIAVYLLVHKKTKNCTLTVHVGPGANGRPLITAIYKKGEVVPYSYEALHSYSGLKVTLDGVEVPARGRVTMDMDHALSASASLQYRLEVTTIPAGAKIFLDYADTGFVTPHTFTFSSPAKQNLLLRYECGFQDGWWDAIPYSDSAPRYPIEMQPGIHDEFVAPLSSCWQPRDPARLAIVAGNLAAAAPERGYQYALYSHPFPTTYTITARLRVTSRLSERFGQTAGIVLSTTPDMAASSGYELSFFGDRRYVIYKNNRYNHLNDAGNWRYIKAPTLCAPRDFAPGAWNTIKIVKVGANYTFYVNDRFVYSFVNDDYDVRYVSLALFGKGVKVDFDWIWLEPWVAAGSVPGAKLEEGPEMEGARGTEN